MYYNRAMRTIEISEGEHYHIFNRGVEKRDIFLSQNDVDRFLESMDVFNSETPVGSIFELRYQKDPLGSSTPKTKKQLVDIVCYCLNPNHFHMIVYQKSERGIQKFMQKLGTGYTNYFNEKYKRTGALFQGRYKAVHIESNEQLLHTSVYVNLNNRFGSSVLNLSASSWGEYVEGQRGFSKKDIVLEQFRSTEAYRRFAESSLKQIIQKKQSEKEIRWLLGS